MVREFIIVKRVVESMGTLRTPSVSTVTLYCNDNGVRNYRVVHKKRNLLCGMTYLMLVVTLDLKLFIQLYGWSLSL